ncbi:hypothetical protein [Adhaeribacter rhizoryzae]|uniref:Uncharacterized protein n=1 Tax=Adhaeribacter rhizoryzae TaxID=2607907 RepID=A0A5M6DP43_9BACT|nr:hypothetical protein [Adhaeribacter rhizoryzae]KAA5549203.1 hypothetical protein F0145_01015 [Adhaeribacter rhizoryzae]
MRRVIVYQTLEDRDTDLGKLELNGPYPCKWPNTWLGHGYYFWDSFIENAHWWGQEIRNYSNGYIICEAICDFNDSDCCDLVGNTEHLKLFHDTYEFLKQKGLANSKTTVGRIIQYLKEDVKTFKYSATRALGFRSKNFHSKFSFTLPFENGKPAYLDFTPAIQICFYSKTSLNLRGYKIKYPPKYSDDYLV